MINANEVVKAMCEKYQAATVAHADGTTKSFKITAIWLLHGEPSG